ncbi:hypothetical protein BBK36DRAFT_1181140, partial [Trichoderma citrinoviride]
ASAVLLPPELLDGRGQARQASHISRHSRSQWQQLRVGQGVVMARTEHEQEVLRLVQSRSGIISLSYILVGTTTYYRNADAAAFHIAIWPSVTEIWTCYRGHKMPKACSWTQGRLQHRPAHGTCVDGEVVP